MDLPKRDNKFGVELDENEFIIHDLSRSNPDEIDKMLSYVLKKQAETKEEIPVKTYNYWSSSKQWDLGRKLPYTTKASKKIDINFTTYMSEEYTKNDLAKLALANLIIAIRHVSLNPNEKLSELASSTTLNYLLSGSINDPTINFALKSAKFSSDEVSLIEKAFGRKFESLRETFKTNGGDATLNSKDDLAQSIQQRILNAAQNIKTLRERFTSGAKVFGNDQDQSKIRKTI